MPNIVRESSDCKNTKRFSINKDIQLFRALQMNPSNTNNDFKDILNQHKSSPLARKITFKTNDFGLS